MTDPHQRTADEYLHTSFPDGDCDFIDGVVLERHIGSPVHSAFLGILIGHLAAFDDPLDADVLPSCRIRVSETRYRVPDITMMLRPFLRTGCAILDPPFLIVEILSAEDEMGATLQRLTDYENLGVKHIVIMDPEDRITFVFVNGDLLQRDLTSFEIPGRGELPFDSRALLNLMDEE